MGGWLLVGGWSHQGCFKEKAESELVHDVRIDMSMKRWRGGPAGGKDRTGRNRDRNR